MRFYVAVTGAKARGAASAFREARAEDVTDADVERAAFAISYDNDGKTYNQMARDALNSLFSPVEDGEER